MCGSSVGADKVADNEDTTFWASEYDPKEPVVFKLDLGGSKQLQALDIVWEFPAKAFSVSVSDGAGSQQVFATSSNVLHLSHMVLGRTVNTIIVEMAEVSAARARERERERVVCVCVSVCVCVCATLAR